MLLVLDNGSRTAFGPKDEVLQKMVQNHKQIAQSAGPGGVQ
jgi:ATP-binding cassette subfamily C protein